MGNEFLCEKYSRGDNFFTIKFWKLRFHFQRFCSQEVNSVRSSDYDVFIGVYNKLNFSNIKKGTNIFLVRKKGEVFFQPNIYQNPATVPSKFLPAPSAFLPNIISNALELLIFLVKLLLIPSICWVPLD